MKGPKLSETSTRATDEKLRGVLFLRIAIVIAMMMAGPAVKGQSEPAVPKTLKAESSKPTSASVVNPSPKVDGWEVGDIQVTFADGQTEILTHHEHCGRPHVSGNGDVGWSVWNDFDPAMSRYFHSGESLRVRLRDGTIKNFTPNSLFIMEWGFADHDSTVVIKSMAHHGAASFIYYDLATGKELGRQDGYAPYDKTPDWAKPFSDDRP